MQELRADRARLVSAVAASPASELELIGQLGEVSTAAMDTAAALATAQAVVAQLTQRQGEMQAEKLELDGMIRILSVNS